MATTVYGNDRNNEKEWISIKSREVCPICGSRKGRCSKYVKRNSGEIILYKCKYKQSNTPSKSEGWYLHYVNQIDAKDFAVPKFVKIEDIKPKFIISEEDIILRDKVYRKMREALRKLTGEVLETSHYEDLQKRGLSKEEIDHMGFFSVPKNKKIFYDGYKCKLQTAIVKELMKNFKAEELIRVPGFSKATAKGSDFVIFLNTIKNRNTNKYEDIDGYFIPYNNKNGLIIGMQYRLTQTLVDEKGKVIRYLWYTSKDVSCGSPIDYYKPLEIIDDNSILMTEGATKGKIAASKLKIRGLAEAGVGNYRNLVSTLEGIEQIEGKKFRVFLALDMDKYSNKDVRNAELRTVALLKLKGHQVTLVEWDDEDGKGIDEKLFKSGPTRLRYLNI